MGFITIAFDDGYKDTFESCAGLLAAKGLPATFAVPSSMIGRTLEKRPVMSREEIIHLKDMGHEIASHSEHHGNLLDLFMTNGEQTVRAEMSDSRTVLEKITGGRIEAMVFPFIEKNNNPALRTLASEYYSSSRITSDRLIFNKLPVRDAFSIQGYAVTRDVSLDSLNRIADMAHQNDLWVIEVFHLVSGNNTLSAHRDEPYRFFTHIADFYAHIDHILSGDIQVLTQSQAIDKYCSPSR